MKAHVQYRYAHTQAMADASPWKDYYLGTPPPQGFPPPVEEESTFQLGPTLWIQFRFLPQEPKP